MPRKDGAITKTFSFEGKRYFITAKTEKEAIEKVALKKRELEEGKKQLDPRYMTVEMWATKCFDAYKNNIDISTKKKQWCMVEKWIIGSIGNLRLKDVRPMHCQNIMNSMQGYATDTMRKLLQHMRFIFEKAIENGFIRENPARFVNVPKGHRETRRAITEKERAMILQVCDTKPKYLFFLFMLFCGCRPGEVAGIQGMDIKIEDGQPILHIRGTKTKNADRYVPIPPYLYERLPKKEPFEYFLTNGKGQYLNMGNRTTLWNTFKHELNIAMGCKVYRNKLIPPYPVAEDLVPYCLRHTYCTDLQKQGVDVRTAQYLMGHSDITMTANIYTHTDMSEVLKVGQIFNNSAQNVVPTVVPKPQTIENAI